MNRTHLFAPLLFETALLVAGCSGGQTGEPGLDVYRGKCEPRDVDAQEVEQMVKPYEQRVFEAPMYWLDGAQNPPHSTWYWLNKYSTEPAPLNPAIVESETTLSVSFRYAGTEQVHSPCGEVYLPFAASLQSADGALAGEFLIVASGKGPANMYFASVEGNSDLYPEFVVLGTEAGTNTGAQADTQTAIDAGTPASGAEPTDPSITTVAHEASDLFAVVIRPEFAGLPSMQEYFTTSQIVTTEDHHQLSSEMMLYDDKPYGILVFEDERIAVFPTSCRGKPIDEEQRRSSMAAAINAVPELTFGESFDGLVRVQIEPVADAIPCVSDWDYQAITAKVILDIGTLHAEQLQMVSGGEDRGIDRIDEVYVDIDWCVSVTEEAVVQTLVQDAFEFQQGQFDDHCDTERDSCTSKREKLERAQALIDAGLSSVDFCLRSVEWRDGQKVLAADIVLPSDTEPVSLRVLSISLPQ